MAEDTVVKEQLTESMIEAGAQLLARLKSLSIPLTAVFWWYDAEINEWRLVFASPEVSAKGSRGIKGEIWNVLHELGNKTVAWPPLTTRVIDSDQPLVRLVNSVLEAYKGQAPVRFAKGAINGQYIDDVLIYGVN